jgi:hypothetical protein
VRSRRYAPMPTANMGTRARALGDSAKLAHIDFLN